MSKESLELYLLRANIAEKLSGLVPVEYIWKNVLGYSDDVIKDFKNKAYFDFEDLQAEFGKQLLEESDDDTDLDDEGKDNLFE